MQLALCLYYKKRGFSANKQFTQNTLMELKMTVASRRQLLSVVFKNTVVHIQDIEILISL